MIDYIAPLSHPLQHIVAFRLPHITDGLLSMLQSKLVKLAPETLLPRRP